MFSSLLLLRSVVDAKDPLKAKKMADSGGLWHNLWTAYSALRLSGLSDLGLAGSRFARYR